MIVIGILLSVQSCKKESIDIPPTPDPIPTLTEFNKGFIFEINTKNQGSGDTKFVLPLDGASTYNFHINWGDGKIEKVSGSSLINVTHTYDSVSIPILVQS